MSSQPPFSPPTPPAPQHIHHHYHPQKEVSTAVLLEVIPGLFGIFGIGHIYTERVGIGLLFMFGFWVVSAINFLLTFVLIGVVTGPLCWIGALIISPITAANYCKLLRANAALPPAEQAIAQSKYEQ